MNYSTPTVMQSKLIKPVRLQLSREKGFRLKSPNGLPVVVVSRPSKWGNPFDIADYGRAFAVSRFRLWMQGVPTTGFAGVPPKITELRGKNLACWCKLPKPGEPDICHAAVLLEIANG